MKIVSAKSYIFRYQTAAPQKRMHIVRCHDAIVWMLANPERPFAPIDLKRALGIPRRENACRLARSMEKSGFVRRIPATVTSRPLYLPAPKAAEWLKSFHERLGVPSLVPVPGRPLDALGRPMCDIRYIK